MPLDNTGHIFHAAVKKGDDNLFDVTMGSYDGAEVCELVGLYILHNLGNKYGKENIGLYRDDGLAAFNKISGPQAERIKKDFQKILKELDLKIEIKTNLKVVDFLDVTFNLATEMYYPFKKPNEKQPISTPNQITHQTLSNTYLHRSVDEFWIYLATEKFLKKQSRIMMKD